MLTQNKLNKFVLGLSLTVSLLGVGSITKATLVGEPSDYDLENTLGKIEAVQEDQNELNELLQILSDLSEQVSIRQIELDYCETADQQKLSYAQEVLSIASQIETQVDKSNLSEVRDAIDLIQSDLNQTDICE